MMNRLSRGRRLRAPLVSGEDRGSIAFRQPAAFLPGLGARLLPFSTENVVLRARTTAALAREFVSELRFFRDPGMRSQPLHRGIQIGIKPLPDIR